MNGIADGTCLHHLNYLLEFLAAWEKRPAYLTLMAYQWCSTISEAVGRLGPSEMPICLPDSLQYILRYQLRFRSQDLATDAHTRIFLKVFKGFSSTVGPGCDPVHSDATSHTPGHLQHMISLIYPYLLSIILEIGFRRVASGPGQPALHLDHTSHHEWVFESAFSSNNDQVVADAMCMRIMGGDSTPPGLCAHYLAKRVKRGTPFSPRLRQASIHTIERIWRNELKASGLDTVCWLNCLNVDADDIADKDHWVELLVDVIRSPAGLESLSSHYWRLLGELVVASNLDLCLAPHDVEVMRSLEKAKDWEKLGVWMVVVWSLLPNSGIPGSELMEGIEEVTLESLLRRPSALQGFEDLCEVGGLSLGYLQGYKNRLQWICNRARAEQLPSESPPPLYVSARTVQHLLILISIFASGNRLTSSLFFSFLLWGTTASESVYCMHRGLVYRVRACFL